MATNQGFEYTLSTLLHGVAGTGTFERVFSPTIYQQSNQLPPFPVVISPNNTKRVSQNTPFIFDVPTNRDTGERVHFRIRVYPRGVYTTPAYTFASNVSAAGWEYSTDGGLNYTAFPAEGLLITAQVRIRYTATNIAPNQYDWQVTSYDGQMHSSYVNTQVSIGNRIEVTLDAPIQTSAKAVSIVPVVFRTIPTDGTVKATMKVYACNNGFDAIPTWEDVTTVVTTQGRSHSFVSNAKTAANWGVNLKIVIEANDSMEAISLDGFAFSFN